MLDKKRAIQIVQAYSEEVKKTFQPIAIVLYGSYITGNASENSDIDVAVIFDGFNGDWLEASAVLWKLRRNISDDIEPILLDIQTDESSFAKTILNTGEFVYKAG